MSEMGPSRPVLKPLIGPGGVLTSSLLAVVTAPFAARWYGPILLLFLILILALACRIRVGRLASAVAGLWPFFAFALVIHVLSSAVSPPDPSGITGSVGVAAATGGLLLGRLFCVVAASSLILMAYPAQEYGRLMVQGNRGPLWLRRRRSQLGLVVTLALGFIPTLRAEMSRIQLAWANRGLGLGSGRIAQVRSLQRTTYPLLVSAFRRADHTATALEARGYDPSVIQTHRAETAIRLRDWLAVGVMAAGCATVLVV
jgi:energy-coupling factor transporter transmembrane protein EcfT